MAADNTPGASNGHNEYMHQLSQPSRLSADGLSSSAVSMATIGAGTLGAEGLGIAARKGSKYDKKIGHYRKDSVGQVTYKKRPTSELMAAIQLGINHSVGSQNPKPMRDVLYEDFHFVETHAFPRDGSTSTPAHRWSDFRFKTYAPAAFRYFRELFRIKPDDFLCSLCTRPLTELSNPGASGSIFYITEDDEFIIKTVQHKEADFLQKLLPGYYMNLNQNPCTLLPKFYGLYCYQCSGKNIRFVIMNNILPSSIPLHEKYDLKGSTYKRKASKHEKMKKSPTLKDLDFRELHPDGLGLETETYQALIRTIDRDCRVLQSFKIMDYSLLLAIHRIGAEVNSSLPPAPSHMDTSMRPDSYQRSMSVESQTGMVYKPRLALYSTAMEAIQAGSDTQFVGGIPAYDNKNGDRLVLHIGIIDILQSYRLAKKLEHTVKSMVHDGDSVSVHQPGFYAQRFQSFCSTFVFRKFFSTSANGRNSPTKRRSLLAPSGLAAATGMPNTRRKSLIPPLEAAKDKPASSQPNKEVASMGDKPDILPRPTPPPSHSVSLLDVHTSPVSPALRKQPLSVSMHSMMSTPSHTDRTDAAMSFTASSPSLGSLNTSPIAPLTVTADINIDASESFSTPGNDAEVVNYSERTDFSVKDEGGETLEEETLVRDLTEITRL